MIQRLSERQGFSLVLDRPSFLNESLLLFQMELGLGQLVLPIPNLHHFPRS